MRFNVVLDVDNDAFRDGQENPFGDDTCTEVARILRTLADRVERTTPVESRDESDPFVLMDTNGNRVGVGYFEET